MLPLLLTLTTAAPPEVPIGPDIRPGALALARQIPPVAPDSKPMPNSQVPERTWDRMFPPVELCAPPAIQPFYKHPRVCLVAVCPCDGGGVAERKSGNTWVKEFSSPAHVPIPRFDQDGRPVCGDGLVVYEGMRLTVDPGTGLYDLTFTATVPNTTVVLRMQLCFSDPQNVKLVHGQVVPEQYTLTIPPIRMEMPRDAKSGDPASTTFHIAHRGYSTMFHNQPPPNRPYTDKAGHLPLPKIGSDWDVKRDGTARFGTPVAIEDPNR